MDNSEEVKPEIKKKKRNTETNFDLKCEDKNGNLTNITVRSPIKIQFYNFQASCQFSIFLGVRNPKCTRRRKLKNVEVNSQFLSSPPLFTCSVIRRGIFRRRRRRRSFLSDLFSLSAVLQLVLLLQKRKLNLFSAIPEEFEMLFFTF